MKNRIVSHRDNVLLLERRGIVIERRNSKACKSRQSQITLCVVDALDQYSIAAVEDLPTTHFFFTFPRD